jgi:hypothetical protein
MDLSQRRDLYKQVCRDIAKLKRTIENANEGDDETREADAIYNACQAIDLAIKQIDRAYYLNRWKDEHTTDQDAIVRNVMASYNANKVSAETVVITIRGALDLEDL